METYFPVNQNGFQLSNVLLFVCFCFECAALGTFLVRYDNISRSNSFWERKKVLDQRKCLLLRSTGKLG